MSTPLLRSSSRILAVDDDPAILELIVTRLSIYGYQVLYARDGHEALRSISDMLPAAMILDINMPHLDGFGVLESLARSGALQRLPTMVLTARNQQGDVQRAVRMGARDFLAKPFDDKQLITRVRRLMRKPEPRPAPTAPTHSGVIDDPSFMI